VWDYRGRRISKAEELSQGLGMPVLAMLPRLSRREVHDTGKWNVAEDHYVYDEWIEAVNAARTMILHAAREESVKAVMVASALEGEGKTSLACHLAASLAHKFKRVLIVDADLRKPSVHKRFHTADGPGLSELLRGEAGLEEVIQPTQVKNLSMIAAGRCDYQVIQALAQEKAQEVIEQLKKEFDFIVIDSSPVLHVADPLILAPKVDAVLFSVLREVSRLPAVYAAYEKILMLGVRVLGTIVHGMPRRRRGYSYSMPAR
jgi:capsular exopolysaccharide synthesis family protein